MELRHIRYFVAVAEELNMGRAAARLHIVQPALSKQIAALEKEMEVQLFLRSKGRLTLTAPGKSFLADARDVLLRLDRATQTARAIDRGEAGTLEVGFVGAAMRGTLPRILREHRRRFPGLRFRLLELTSAAALAQLRSGSLDVAFLRPPLSDEEIVFETVAREPLVVALPDNHALAKRQAVDLRDLAGETFLMTVPHESPTLYARSIELCRSRGFIPTSFEEADTVDAGMNFVAAGFGVLLAPGALGRGGWPGVAFRPLTPETVELELALAYRPEGASGAVLTFVETVHEVVAATASQPS